MDRQQIATTLVLKHLGIPLSMETFNERLVIQKVIHLAQALGVHLGYHYQWYLRGPYCPVLTRDMYAIVSEVAGGDDESERWSLEGQSKRGLDPLKERLAGLAAGEHPRQMELLASVNFLLATNQVREVPQDIREKLRAFNKDFTEDEVQDALAWLKERGLPRQGWVDS
jgi:uncharacterized protein YwgA